MSLRAARPLPPTTGAVRDLGGASRPRDHAALHAAAHPGARPHFAAVARVRLPGGLSARAHLRLGAHGWPSDLHGGCRLGREPRRPHRPSRAGSPERDRLRDAVVRAGWCSADPLCIESEASGVDSLNLAACHACCLLPETSCEEMNVFLDRGLLVGARRRRSRLLRARGVPDGTHAAAGTRRRHAEPAELAFSR